MVSLSWADWSLGVMHSSERCTIVSFNNSQNVYLRMSNIRIAENLHLLCVALCGLFILRSLIQKPKTCIDYVMFDKICL